MGMTMTQKILAAHAGLDSVSAGQLVLVDLDRVLGNDVTSPVAIREFNKMGKDDVFDKEKVIMVMDHFVPNKDIKAAIQAKTCRDFCNELDIPNFMTPEKWALNTPSFRSRDLLSPVTWSSEPTPTPAPMVHLVPSPPVSVLRIWPAEWPPERHGSRYLPPSALS